MRKIAEKINNNDYKQKRNRSFRKALLSKLIENIEDGNLNKENKVKSVNPSRPEYKSPMNRQPYMEIDEMEAGTPNVW